MSLKSRKCLYGIGRRREVFRVISWLPPKTSPDINSRNTETKVLKQLVRDHIDPKKDLGHSDRHGKKKEEKAKPEKSETKAQGAEEQTTAPDDGVKRNPDGTICEDCR
jgi:hypothetical protein